ncbi:hypothetical protein [Haloarchaeobius sp. FL176]|mgnify:FL=1|uniref:hypothetical protein n=1 Tax=Haloarchaeobius sp. FL176 TaxID=2967129 RepID=UPI0021488A26|nr:hypothetical protein [Haloarchaeobius sp. FL176]
MTDHQTQSESTGDAVDDAIDSLRSKLDEFGGDGGKKEKAARKGHELVDELEETITGLTSSDDSSRH